MKSPVLGIRAYPQRIWLVFLGLRVPSHPFDRSRDTQPCLGAEVTLAWIVEA